MKKTKLLIFIILAVFLLSAAESFAYPRYRTCKVVRRVYPSYYTGCTTTSYYVVKKPKIKHRHHKKVITRV